MVKHKLLLSTVNVLLLYWSLLFQHSDALIDDYINLDIDYKTLRIFINGLSQLENDYYFYRKSLFNSTVPPPFLSVQCEEDVQRVSEDLDNAAQYARRIADAIGRRPSGVARGNLQWLGSFEQCTDTRMRNETYGPITGRYCLAQLQHENLSSIAVNLGLCVPDSCVDTDVLGLLQWVLATDSEGISVFSAHCVSERSLDGKDIGAIVICSLILFLVVLGTLVDCLIRIIRNFRTRAELRKRMREEEQKRELESKYFGGPGPFFTLDVYQLEGQNRSVHNISQISANAREEEERELIQDGAEDDVTMMESEADGKEETGVIISFSLLRTLIKGVSTSSRPASKKINCVKGMRVLTTLWIILINTYLYYVEAEVSDSPLMIPNVMKGFMFQVISNGSVCIDTLFFLSGFVLGYKCLNDLLQHHGRIMWTKYFIYRIFRFVPVYMFVLMMWVSVFRHFPQGPNQDKVEEAPDLDQCDTYWWTNILHINNFFSNTEESANSPCMEWSWYIANEMQFFFISPILIILLYKYSLVGVAVVSSLVIMDMGVSGGISSKYHLQPLFYNKDEEYRDKENMMYTFPYFRVAPYAVGLLLAYIIHRFDGKIVIKKPLMVVGWVVAVGLMAAVIFGLSDYISELRDMDETTAAVYEATHRTVWAVAVAWVCLVCVTGQGGIVSSILGWSGWRVLDRLSYSAYLLHVPVICNFYWSSAVPIHYTPYTFINLYVAHVVFSYMGAFLLYLCIQGPFVGLGHHLSNYATKYNQPDHSGDTRQNSLMTEEELDMKTDEMILEEFGKMIQRRRSSGEVQPYIAQRARRTLD